MNGISLDDWTIGFGNETTSSHYWDGYQAGKRSGGGPLNSANGMGGVICFAAKLV
jgi:hypothetical protein